MRALILACLLSLPAVASAETVWKFTDRSGNVVFSDTPVEGAEPITIQRPLIIPATRAPLSSAPDPVKDLSYQRLDILTPTHDTVYSNEPTHVVVTGISEPYPHRGHLYRLTINGEPYGSPQDIPRFTIPPQDRGTYTLVLQIVDRNLHPVKSSAPVQIHVRKHSLLYKKSR
jgi:hypothetical protein